MTRTTGWRGLLRAKAMSPAGFLKYALLIAFLHGVCRALGWRKCMSALSLTAPAGWSMDEAAVAAGLFLGSWFLLVFLAPTLVLASGLFALLLRREARGAPPPRPT